MNKKKNEIIDNLEFTQYLQELGYTKTTINTKKREVVNFSNWCNSKGNNVCTINYSDCLQYVSYLKSKRNSIRTINTKLAHLRNYFTYLVREFYRKDNPVENIIIKGESQLLNYTILTSDELEDLYYSFDTENTQYTHHKLTAKRNKVLVGLLVYQGLGTSELKRLLVEHLQLSQGKIYIPICNRSNSRTLELKAWQIMELIEYVNEIRPILIKQVKNPLDYNQLFPYGEQFNVLKGILNKLKQYNQKVTSIKQLRASVITNWLKQYNLRKVQYLAGHRHISSTERYVQDDLENLHDIIDNFHPMSL